MLTRNWYKLASLLIFATDTNASVRCREFTGYNYSIPASNKLGVYAMGYIAKTLKTGIATGSGFYGVLFGTGDTTPTLDDYTLSGDVISTITIVTSQTSIGANGDSEYAELATRYTLTNTGTQAITVREVALAYYGCMLERTVLDTPITIEPDGIGQVTYTIRMNYPTA